MHQYLEKRWKRGLIGLHEGSFNLGKGAWTLFNEELRGDCSLLILKETRTHTWSNHSTS